MAVDMLCISRFHVFNISSLLFAMLRKFYEIIRFYISGP
jgi:hypothetical protein